MREFLINDVFWTVQGEGAFAGSRALFIRLPFCNLKCSWCDTEFNTYKKVTTDELLSIFKDEQCRFCVITGGEPTMNKQTPELVSLLKQNGFFVSCESNGTFSPPCEFDWLTVSPKRFQDDPYYVNPTAFTQAHEFKYVVDSEFDFSILQRHTPNDGRRYSLSPEWGTFSENIQKIINFQKENPSWRISLQTHKIMGVK